MLDETNALTVSEESERTVVKSLALGGVLAGGGPESLLARALVATTQLADVPSALDLAVEQSIS